MPCYNYLILEITLDSIDKRIASIIVIKIRYAII